MVVGELARSAACFHLSQSSSCAEQSHPSSPSRAVGVSTDFIFLQDPVFPSPDLESVTNKD